MFFLRSLVFTIFSPSFYKEALGRGGKKALGNYLLFTILVTTVTTVYFAVTFGSSLLNIPNNLGDFPDVTIENGELTMTPSRKYDLSEGSTYIVVDPTGSTTEIPSNYAEGFLLTKNHILLRSTDSVDDRELNYNDLLSEFDQDSFTIDRNSLADFLQTAGLVILITSPIFIFLASFLGTLISVLLVALLGFIVLSAMEQTDAFKKSFILALFAAIPVFYVSTIFSIFGKLLGMVGFNFSLGSICCLIPIIFSLFKWGVFWGIGAYGITREDEGPSQEESVPENEGSSKKASTPEEDNSSKNDDSLSQKAVSIPAQTKPEISSG